MKRLVYVFLSSLLMVSAMLPPSALASSSGMTTARHGRVQVIELRGEDIGPATYHESRTFTPDKRKASAANVHPDGKASGWYEASNTINRYSWLGIWVYSLTVTGEYHTDGTIIDQYGGTDWAASTTVMWSSTQERSSWVSQSASSGEAKASAKFVNAIPTPIGGIQLRQVSDSVSALARP